MSNDNNGSTENDIENGEIDSEMIALRKELLNGLLVSLLYIIYLYISKLKW
jgi:hypothetical protein